MRDAESRFPRIVRVGSSTFLRFHRATTHATYTVRTSTAITDGSWTTRAVNPGSAGGDVDFLLDPAWAVDGRLFAEVVVTEAP